MGLRPLIVWKVLVEMGNWDRPIWILRNPATLGSKADLWGDTHFINSLRAALYKQGDIALEVRSGNALPSFNDFRHIVNLELRGLKRATPLEGALNVIWVISHPEEVSLEELQGYDLVFGASTKWCDFVNREWRIPAEPLLQATDPSVFGRRKLDQIEASSRNFLPGIFVGSTSQGRPRKMVEACLASEVPIKVYGPNWSGRVSEDAFGGDSVDNRELGRLYQSSSFVLCDHWGDMSEWNFIQNRVFDAICTGTPVVSDPMDALTTLFGDAVVQLLPNDLRAMKKEDFLDLLPSEREIEDLRRCILADYTFDSRAKLIRERVLSR